MQLKVPGQLRHGVVTGGKGSVGSGLSITHFSLIYGS